MEIVKVILMISVHLYKAISGGRTYSGSALFKRVEKVRYGIMAEKYESESR